MCCCRSKKQHCRVFLSHNGLQGKDRLLCGDGLITMFRTWHFASHYWCHDSQRRGQTGTMPVPKLRNSAPYSRIPSTQVWSRLFSGQELTRNSRSLQYRSHRLAYRGAFIIVQFFFVKRIASEVSAGNGPYGPYGPYGPLIAIHCSRPETCGSSVLH